jgi:transketolase
MTSPARGTTRFTPSPGPATKPPFDPVQARTRCWRMRKRILQVSQKVSALHIGGAFSCLEIVDTIYHAVMRRDADGNSPDTFILSKGHGSMAQYAVLEEMGIIPPEEMDLTCQPGGRRATHPDYGLPGIEASTGSLGHGLALAVGMSLADGIQQHDRLVYVVMSDGELEEGSVWEVMMLAPSLGVKNVIAVVDLNDFQSLGRTSKILPNFYPVAEKIRAFGWEAVEVDGHCPQAVHDAIVGRKGERPLMVVARTIKGKGVSYMENVPMWHYRSPNPQEYQQALDELDRAHRE